MRTIKLPDYTIVSSKHWHLFVMPLVTFVAFSLGVFFAGGVQNNCLGLTGRSAWGLFLLFAAGLVVVTETVSYLELHIKLFRLMDFYQIPISRKLYFWVATLLLVQWIASNRFGVLNIFDVVDLPHYLSWALHNSFILWVLIFRPRSDS